MIKKIFALFVLTCSIAWAQTSFIVPNTFFPNRQAEWDSIIYTIQNSSETDFILYWSGLGGRIVMAENIFYKLQTTHKRVTVVITGEAISAHGLVACYLPQLVVFNSGSLTLHNAYEGRKKDGTKIYDDLTTYELLNICVDAKVISAKERDLIIQNKLRLTIYPNGYREFRKDWE